MFKDDYKKELDRITLTDEFKQQTVQLLKDTAAQAKNLPSTAKNTVPFSKKRNLRIAAGFGVMILSAVMGAYFLQNYFIKTDNSANETVPQQETVVADKEKQYDAAPAQTKSRVYTINDAIMPEDSADTVAHNGKMDKVQFNTESGEGYGFEGYQLYDISRLSTNNLFGEDIVFDSLPLYEFSPMDYEDIRAEFRHILDITGMTEEDINYTEYQWVEIVDDGDRKVINRTIETDTAEKPTETAQLYTVKVDMTGGLVYISHALSEIDLYLYDAVPVTDELLGQYAMENYTRLLGENTESYVYDTYNIYGEQHFFPHYVHTITGDYARDVFNNSAGATLVWKLDDLWMSHNDKGENIHFQYTPESCYTATESLPAISWQQALGMLYNGEYLSSRPEPLAEDTVVEKIELVYKAPPYYPPADYRAGYALPFYKFYVELPEYTWETDKGILKTYGAYYVCAIDPGYVEYTDGYVNFNM
ncbi:MAG: hypothetical protein IJ410_00150 [Oscillospiraceae bacterium]|nr:hypothetical protein [Oscillospiraceae bacterium]